MATFARALIFLIGFGFDSLLAGLAIGFWALSARERLRLAVAFGACDAVATLLGSLWPHTFQAPLAFATCLACLFLLVPAAQTRRRLLYALPVLLSVDNLFAGAPASTAPAFGAVSTAMALAGLTLATWCRRVFWTREAEA